MCMKILPLAFSLIASAAAAERVTYVCDVRPSSDGWLQTPVTVTFDTAAERAAVEDPIIKDNVGRAIEAKYNRRNNGRLEAIWDLGNVRQSRGQRRVSWILQVNPKTGKSIYRARWDMVGEGAANPPSTRGTCKTVGSPDLLG